MQTRLYAPDAARLCEVFSLGNDLVQIYRLWAVDLDFGHSGHYADGSEAMQRRRSVQFQSDHRFEYEPHSHRGRVTGYTHTETQTFGHTWSLCI